MLKIKVNGEMINAEIIGSDMAKVERDGYTDYYRQCCECGEWIPENDIITLSDGDNVCIDCVDDSWDIIYCDHCEEYTRTDGVYHVYTCRYGEEVWCSNCAYSDAYQCCECGEWFDDCNIVEYNGDYYCEECYEERPRLIVPYHYGNPEGIQFHGELKPSSYIQGYVSYEAEFFGDGEAIAEAVYNAVGGYDFCHFEDDCTVDVEIVGQPHTVEMLYHEADKYKAMFEAIQNAGGHVGDRAGLHIHISRTAFGSTLEERASNIAKISMLFSSDEAFNMLAKIARRDDFYWCKQVKGDRLALKSSAQRQGGAHDIAVNLEHTDTVEFRLGGSMDTYEEFIDWIEILIHIVKTAPSIEESVATNIGNWFNWLYDDVPKHILDIFNRNGIAIPVAVNPLTIADYENIISQLCSKVQEAQRKRNVTLSAMGLTQDEMPKILTKNDILLQIVDNNTRKALLIAE